MCDPSPDPLLFYPALGKAIQCLAKIGDELYIEAKTDGVSSHGSESSILTTALMSSFPHNCYIICKGCLVAKALDCRPRGPRFWPHWQQGFFLFSVHSALTQNLRRRDTFVSFGVDIKPSVLGTKTGFCLLQALVNHHCGKPLRGNKNTYLTTCMSAIQGKTWDSS